MLAMFRRSSEAEVRVFNQGVPKGSVYDAVVSSGEYEVQPRSDFEKESAIVHHVLMSVGAVGLSGTFAVFANYNESPTARSSYPTKYFFST